MMFIQHLAFYMLFLSVTYIITFLFFQLWMIFICNVRFIYSVMHFISIIFANIVWISLLIMENYKKKFYYIIHLHDFKWILELCKSVSDDRHFFFFLSYSEIKPYLARPRGSYPVKSECVMLRSKSTDKLDSVQKDYIQLYQWQNPRIQLMV